MKRLLGATFLTLVLVEVGPASDPVTRSPSARLTTPPSAEVIAALERTARCTFPDNSTLEVGGITEGRVLTHLRWVYWDARRLAHRHHGGAGRDLLLGRPDEALRTVAGRDRHVPPSTQRFRHLRHLGLVCRRSGVRTPAETQTMRTELYPIPDVPTGRVAILPRPRAGDWLADEVAAWRAVGVEVVVSLLDDDEITELGLADEEACCSGWGLRFVRFPIPDRGTPEARAAFTALVTSLVAELRQGRYVGVHCRMGIGRSGLLAACLLVALGATTADAWAAVERGRGRPVPDTQEQRAWAERWAAHLGESRT